MICTRSWFRLSCLFILAAFVGCGPSSTSAAGTTIGKAGPTEVLHVWASPEGFGDEVLEGCRYWSVLGVECVLVAEREKADVRFAIRSYPKGLSTRCVKSARAIAHQNGNVEVDLKLFMSKLGVRRRTLVATIAHETGHELGLDHLPLSCEAPDPVKEKSSDECAAHNPGPIALPDGTLVCGPGIMNANRPEDFRALTRNDIRAFSLRDPKWRKTDPPRVP